MTATLVHSDATASSDIYGVINSIYNTQNSSEDDVYQYVGLANGAEFDAMTKDQKADTYANNKFALMYITKTGDEIKSVEAVTPNYKEEVSDNKTDVNGSKVVVYGNSKNDATFAGMKAYQVEKADSEKVKIDGAYQVIEDAKVYVANLKSNKKFDKWTIGSTADISINGYVVLVQTDKDSNNWDTVLYISDKDAEDCVEANLFKTVAAEQAEQAVKDAKARVATVKEAIKAGIGDVTINNNLDALVKDVKEKITTVAGNPTNVELEIDTAKVKNEINSTPYPVTVTITDKTVDSVSDTIVVNVKVIDKVN